MILPRTIPLSVISSILASAYQQKETARSQIQRDGTLRDIAVLELLFATGVRVSELCTLGYDDVRLEEGEIKIYGKGAKERFVQIANPNVLGALHCYQEAYKDVITQSGAFFVNRLHKPYPINPFEASLISTADWRAWRAISRRTCFGIPSLHFYWKKA